LNPGIKKEELSKEELLKKKKDRRGQDVEDERRKDHRKYGEKAESKQVRGGWEVQPAQRILNDLQRTRLSCRSKIWLLPTPSLLSSQQFVSLSQSSFVSQFKFTDGRKPGLL
jgi:hypothetical protein